ncbi:hypothetical protein ACIQTN_29340 [Streptomyces werraensis]|uniref:hypothetical protein n=1 Tax=Streptomyces werraensis TaxID=68284 RepID=UPI00382C8561
MPNSPRPPGSACCPTRDHLNDAIRDLMNQPASHERTRQWAALLEQWADACPCTCCRWTTAA